jgi:PEGA domain
MSSSACKVTGQRVGKSASRRRSWALLAVLPTVASPIVGLLPALPLSGASLAAIAVVTSVTSIARAEESPEVEALLKRGIQLRKDGKDEEALAVFLDAESQAPKSVRVLLHVATAAQAASKWLMADEYLKKAMSHGDDPYYLKYKDEIEEVRLATAQRVGHFRALGEPDGAEVVLNGQVIGTLPMETPKTLEAGTYIMEVTKPGYFRLRRPISVGGGVLTRESVQLNERAPGSVDPADPQTGVAAEPKSYWGSSAFTWTLAGIGAAAGVTSGISFYLREQAVEHWNDDARCTSQENPDVPRSEICSDVRNDIDTAEQVGIITGVIGVAFAGAALTHWIATGGDSEPGMDTAERRERRSAAQVQCSPGLMNLVCSGTF